MLFLPLLRGRPKVFHAARTPGGDGQVRLDGVAGRGPEGISPFNCAPFSSPSPLLLPVFCRTPLETVMIEKSYLL